MAKFGAGTGLCFNMIVKIFEDVKIDMSFAHGKPKSQMKETFEKLRWGKPIETTGEGPGGTVQTTISFTNEAMETLRGLGVSIASPTLAIETGTSKKVAFEKAYKIALENVRKIGITEAWIEQVRGNRDLNNPQLIPYIQKVQNKLKREGYASFYFKKAQTTIQGKYIQLVGVRPDGTKEILTMTSGPREEWEGKEEVLNKYLEK